MKKSIKLNKKGLYKYLFVVYVWSILTLVYAIMSWDIFRAGSKIGNTPIGGLSISNAYQKLEGELNQPELITLTYGEKVFEIPLKRIGFYYNLYPQLVTVWVHQKTRIFSPFPKKSGSSMYSYTLNEKLLDGYIDEISRSVDSSYPKPYLTVENGKVIYVPQKPGVQVDKTSLKANILEALASNNFSEIPVPSKENLIILSDSQIESFVGRGVKLMNKSVMFVDEETKIEYAKEKLIPLIDLDNSYNQENIDNIVKEISAQVFTEPINPVFRFENDRVVEFQPAKQGKEVDSIALKTVVVSALGKLESSDTAQENVQIPVKRTDPKITTQEVNNLGIKEMIGYGDSNFRGSIASRVYNIRLASSKINGVLVSPGETFSFNEVVGDISAATGYKQAYIIQDGKTILGDGGGVCQVSTTVFRAALNSGLPIIERSPHSYRVTYYEQGYPVGIDATVFYPSTDLKFLNDTPATILVQTYVDPAKYTLRIEFYGTKDGRVVKLGTPIVSGQTPPPDDLYMDDPALPTGTVKQIDWKAWGAKVKFDYSVTNAGGETTTKTFYSNYKPWQAKFLRGTGPAI